MSSLFRPKTTVVQVPSQSQTSGSSEIKPYAPVEPFIKENLPGLVDIFKQDPALFTGSLVPTDAPQTLDARARYANLIQDTIPGFTQDFTNIYQNRLGSALADPFEDPIFQAERGVIADEARTLTERDQLLAQQQAIEAGQFGLGSTALRELQTLQQRQREESTRTALATALKDAEARRLAALGDVPTLGQTVLQTATTPATLQEALGRDVEARDQARLADEARLFQQDQEARRAQAVTLSNLLGGLAGLGSQTQFQQASSGTQGQAFPGASPFTQVTGLIGAAAPAFKGACWVARKVYGEDNPRWQIYREWMFTQAPKWFLNLYIKHGEKFAEWIDDKPLLQKVIRRWMDQRIKNFESTKPKLAWAAEVKV